MHGDDSNVDSFTTQLKLQIISCPHLSYRSFPINYAIFGLRHSFPITSYPAVLSEVFHTPKIAASRCV
jgi:hypothetical protein